jgi:DNA-binding CsgD family transcriptional regulator
MIERDTVTVVDHLIGRGDELGALDHLLARAAAAASTVRVLAGDAGTGKSVLIDWAIAEARQRGFTVLRATGVEFERQLSFSGLTAVLRPVLDRVEGLDSGHARALKTAFGLVDGEAGLLAVHGATLALIASAAEQAPVLVAVDDAHWIDQSSMESLVFAAHRCDADRVLFLFARRPEHACLLDRTEFERIEVAGLDRESAVELLAASGVSAEVAGRCWELTRGNPLALLEAGRSLTPGQRRGDEPLPAVLPLGDRLLDSFGPWIDSLPPATLVALGVAALDPDDDVSRVSAALAVIDGKLDDLCPAETAGVVVITGRNLAWHHPLLRAAVVHQLDRGQRRRVHRALAEAASENGDHERALWHLSESVMGPDEDVAARMAELGTAAARRGMLTAAATTYEHAARLSTDPVDQVDHITSAAWAALSAGDHRRAFDMLSPVIEGVADTRARARMAGILGLAEMWLRGPSVAIPRFETNARAVREIDPGIGAILLLHASAARLLALDLRGARGNAQDAAKLAAISGDAMLQFSAAACDMGFDMISGRANVAAEALGPIGHQALAAYRPGEAALESIEGLVQVCAFGYIVCDDLEAGIDLLRPLVQLGEAQGLSGASLFTRLLLVEALWRGGWWPAALAEMSQLISLQWAVGLGHLVPLSYAQLARVEAGLGHDEACQEHAKEAIGVADKLGIAHIAMFAVAGLGLLHLGMGRYDEAAAVLDLAGPAMSAAEPGWLWWQADAIEALFRAGRTSEAHQALDVLDDRAQATGRRWALAAVERSGALLGRGGPAEDRYAAALAGFREIQAPFEEARTLLLRGEHRLREGSQTDGALDMAAARTVFDRLGARPWSERASAARGEATSASRSLATRLTDAELRVAMAVGQGLSNRQAAEQLFLSVKTVDFHLQGIYRKLGIRNRTQLAALVLSAPTTGLPAA